MIFFPCLLLQPLTRLADPSSKIQQTNSRRNSWNSTRFQGKSGSLSFIHRFYPLLKHFRSLRISATRYRDETKSSFNGTVSSYFFNFRDKIFLKYLVVSCFYMENPKLYILISFAKITRKSNPYRIRSFFLSINRDSRVYIRRKLLTLPSV